MPSLFSDHFRRSLYQSIDWFEKRMLQMTPGGPSEAVGQAVEREMSRESASLRQALERLIDHQEVTREGIEQAINTRIESVRTRMEQMITDLPTRRGHFESVRDQVIGLLNTLKGRIDQALIAYDLTGRRQHLEQQHLSEFRRFIQRVSPSTVQPSTPRTAPERAQERVEVPDRNAMYMRFTDYAQAWRASDGIGERFARNLYASIRRSFARNNTEYRGHTGDDASLVFLADRLQYPQQNSPNNELKTMFLAAHRIFQQYEQQRRSSDPQLQGLFQRDTQRGLRQLRDEFFGRDGDALTVSVDGSIRHREAAVQSFIAGHQPEQQRAAREERAPAVERRWQSEVSREPEVLLRDVETQTLNTVDTQLAKGEVPDRADLVRLQTLVNRVNREVLPADTTLDWQSVQSARVINGQYGTSNPLVAGVAGGSIRLNARPGSASGRPTQIGIEHRDGHTVDVDLPRLLIALQNLRRTFPDLTEGRSSLNLGEIAGQLTPERREQAQERLHQQRYHRMLDAFGISTENREYYRNMPQALARVLRISDLNQRQSTQTWIDAINHLQLTDTMSADEYKFLWVMRSYVRTRNVSGSEEVTLEQFSQQLLSSTEYQSQDRVQNPVQMYAQIVDQLRRDYSGAELANRIHQLTTEYNEFLSRVPAIRELFAFSSLLEQDAPKGGDFSRNLNSLPWSQVVRWLDQAETIPFETLHEGTRCMVLNSGGPTGGNLLIPKSIVDSYRRLRQNNPLFLDLIGLGRSQSVNDATGHSLQGLLYRIYTPAQAEANIDL